MLLSWEAGNIPASSAAGKITASSAAGIRTSALEEALKSASWAATADKASVVEWPGENRIPPTPLADVQPKLDICHCLPPDRTRHKVNGPKVDYNGDYGEGRLGTSRMKVGHDAAHPPEGGLPEDRGLIASRLPLISIPVRRGCQTARIKASVQGRRPAKTKYLSLSPTRQDSTQGQWPKGRLLWGFRGGESRARAEARTLLIYAGHRPTQCNVGLMSLADLGPKSEPSQVCLIIASTGEQGSVLYKGDKGVNDAVHPAPRRWSRWSGGLTASSLPLISISIRYRCQTAHRKTNSTVLIPLLLGLLCVITLCGLSRMNLFIITK